MRLRFNIAYGPDSKGSRASYGALATGRLRRAQGPHAALDATLALDIISFRCGGGTHTKRGGAAREREGRATAADRATKRHPHTSKIAF